MSNIFNDALKKLSGQNTPMSKDLLDSIKKPPQITMPNDRIIMPRIVMPRDNNLADAFHERLIKMINDFDSKLDQSQEVGMRLVSFGQAITFHVQDIGYWNPSIIRFYGKLEDGSPVELIQHVTQLSFLLMAVKRQDTNKPKRPIGFRQDEKKSSEGEENGS